MLQGLYSARSEKGRIALGRFPYTYARVSVMRSFLLGKDDYQRLMKMDVNEIASYLQGSQYRKEIDELGIRFKGMQLMELALNRNLANTWAKLKNISPPNLRSLIAAYLLRVDIWNIKTLVRGKYTKLAQDDLRAMLIPSGFLNEKRLAELARKETVEEILKSTGFIDYSQLSWAVEKFRETKSIIEIENALDRFYYSSMEAFTRRIPEEGVLFRQFIDYELEISALINILRLKRTGTPSKDITRFLIIPKTIRPLASKMANAASASDAARLIEQSRFGKAAESGIREFVANGSLVRLELDLSKLTLKHSALLIHQHPLTVSVILGYMFAKELEVRNIKLMLKAKSLGIDPDFVEQQIVAV
ncbi:TPA: ATP synthase A1 subunit C [Candidatus Woesearchaeota archaeon]|nr:ATP synthase A1 subunit C [Candidatus Woesearchaeota archaeon]